MTKDHPAQSPAATVCFIGFGEAASTLVKSLRPTGTRTVKAYDIKTDDPSPAVRDGKWRDYESAHVAGCRTLREALADAPIVVSTVTADQALVAASASAANIEPEALYLDCNSCAPDTKRRASDAIAGAGARYVDVAVMAAVSPLPGKTPFLVSGPEAAAARAVLDRLGMSATVVPGEVGRASAIKMIRSVMTKGLEALILECVLSARKAGVDDVVIEFARGIVARI